VWDKGKQRVYFGGASKGGTNTFRNLKLQYAILPGMSEMSQILKLEFVKYEHPIYVTDICCLFALTALLFKEC